MTPHIGILAIALLVSTRMVSPSWADPGQTKIDLQAAHLNFLEMAADSQGRFRVVDRVVDRAGVRHDADFVMRQTAAGWMVVDVLFDQRSLLRKALSGAR
ncbi:MAG: hypothetical protein VW495_03320 [Rhodobiaceae bacterium]